MSKNNFTFKYFSPSLNKEYSFLYGEKRRLNHWFKYYLFPKYGKYLFFYDSRDKVFIESFLFLFREEGIVFQENNQSINSENREIFHEDGSSLEKQSRKITNKDNRLLKNGDNRYLFTQQKFIAEVLERKTSLTQNEKAMIGGMRISELSDSISSKLESIDSYIDIYSDLLVNNNIRDHKFIKEDWEIKLKGEERVLDFSDFLIDISVSDAFLKDIKSNKNMSPTFKSMEYEISEQIKEPNLTKSIHQAIINKSHSFFSKKENDISFIDNIKKTTKQYKRVYKDYNDDITKVVKVDLQGVVIKNQKHLANTPKDIYSIEDNQTFMNYKVPKDIYSIEDNQTFMNYKVPKDTEVLYNLLEVSSVGKKDLDKVFNFNFLQKDVKNSGYGDLHHSKKWEPMNREPSSDINIFQELYFKERVSSKEHSGGIESFHELTRTGAYSVFQEERTNNCLKRVPNLEGSSIEEMGENIKRFNRGTNTLYQKEEEDGFFNFEIVNTKQINIIESNHLKETPKNIFIDKIEKELDLSKRLWFVSQYDNKIDYKILPNENHDYSEIEILLKDELILKEYKFNHFLELSENEQEDRYSVVVYNKDYERLGDHWFVLEDYENLSNGIKIKCHSSGRNRYMITTTFSTDEFVEPEYIIVYHPRNKQGITVQYAVTEKMIEEKHPIPFGEDLGLKEIPIPINIMFDFINMLLLMWSKFYFAFTGYTGGKAIYGLLNVVYDWITLEANSEHESLEYYARCYRWLRWEAEKTYNKAKDDLELTGNYWIEFLIQELIDYMISHHVDEMIEFEPVWKMDEYRNSFDDPSFDLEIVLDKFKGIRKKMIDTKKT